MAQIFQAVVWTLCLNSSPIMPADYGWLYRPAYCIDNLAREPAQPYRPQPGDLILNSDNSRLWVLGFRMAFTGHPHHSGIFFAMPDGRLAIFESGPHDAVTIELLDPYPHLCSYAHEGPVWIRQRKTPLTCEQSQRLTAFAMALNHGRFAYARLIMQITPLRSRGPLRTAFVKGPRGIDQRSYFCSEAIMEALAAASLVDPAVTRPRATYPRDLFFDRSPNPYLNKHLDLSACWLPPARWTCSPGQTLEPGKKGRLFADKPIYSISP